MLTSRKALFVAIAAAFGLASAASHAGIIGQSADITSLSALDVVAREAGEGPRGGDRERPGDRQRRGGRATAGADDGLNLMLARGPEVEVHGGGGAELIHRQGGRAAGAGIVDAAG